MTKRIDVYAVGHDHKGTCANVWTRREAAEDDYSRNAGRYLDKVHVYRSVVARPGMRVRTARRFDCR